MYIQKNKTIGVEKTIMDLFTMTIVQVLQFPSRELTLAALSSLSNTKN